MRGRLDVVERCGVQEQGAAMLVGNPVFGIAIIAIDTDKPLISQNQNTQSQDPAPNLNIKEQALNTTAKHRHTYITHVLFITLLVNKVETV